MRKPVCREGVRRWWVRGDGGEGYTGGSTRPRYMIWSTQRWRSVHTGCIQLQSSKTIDSPGGRLTADVGRTVRSIEPMRMNASGEEISFLADSVCVDRPTDSRRRILSTRLVLCVCACEWLGGIGGGVRGEGLPASYLHLLVEPVGQPTHLV